jgi:hypothetical protein
VQRLFLLALAAVALAAPAATAAPRMPIGFYDDNSFRWSPDVAKNLLAAQKAGASIIHVTADWSQIAPTQPASPLSGTDPAYRISDLDALVANAPRYGLQVMINISGAPKWANGGQPPNHPPTSMGSLSQFAQMLAKRYNGRSGHGLVGRWSVWNEPNLGLFLTPQFVGGRTVSVATYLKIYQAAYSGIKAGNRQALVAVGETSNRGRDHPTGSAGNDAVSPAHFAFLLSQLAPNLKFDAWATHPYPTDPFLGPTQKVRFPNVTMTRITEFGVSLQKWFHRRVPIWITEYGEQTKPQFAGGVTYARQASDAKIALQLAAASPYVEMFVWFTIRDSPGTWQSGLLTAGGAKKPAYAAFASVAKTLDGQSQVVSPHVQPTVKVFVPFLAYHDAIGKSLTVAYKVYNGKHLISSFKAKSKLGGDDSASFLVGLRPVHGKQYTVSADVYDQHGQHQKRTIVLMTT